MDVLNYNIDNQQEANSADSAFKLRRAAVFCLLLLLLLCLIPYSPDDYDFCAHGLEGHIYPRNLLGIFGTHCGHFVTLAFGIASYLGLVLALLCSLRRLVRRKTLRRSTPAYPAAIALFTLSASMLFALHPDGFSALSASLNIRTIPGGVIGWQLCAPQDGWLFMLLNSTGCTLVGLVLLLGSLYVIWYYDWQILFYGKMHQRSPQREMLEQPSAYPQGEEAPIVTIVNASEKQLSGRRSMPPPPSVASQSAAPRSARTAPASYQLELPLDPSGQLQSRKPSDTVAPSTLPQPPAFGEDYQLPPPELLDRPRNNGIVGQAKEIENNKQLLQNTLDTFKIDAEVVNAIVGPQVTRFEIAPASSCRIETIGGIQSNISMELCAQNIRCLLPIPGKRLVGIEVPNANPATVTGYELFTDASWLNSKMQIPVVLGKDISNTPVIVDLAKAPHLLIAGTTGSGKSVCMNLIITSLLYKFKPDELKLIMVDPKVVEFKPYSTLPHLIIPIITEVEKTALALRWAVNEMTFRYRQLAAVNVRNLKDFNSRQLPAEPQFDDDGNRIPDKLPFIVVIIDELADVMQCAGKEVEGYLARLAALSRAVGIHVIIATQRPDVKVITGTIKSNFPMRIAFKVASSIDSRTILDSKGAELLVGRGDMLYKSLMDLERIQCGFVDTPEVERIVEYVSAQAVPQFDERVIKALENAEQVEEDASARMSAHGNNAASVGVDADADGGEDLYNRAVEHVIRTRKATISSLQRAFKIGYNRAADLIDKMEENGVIGPQPSSGLREIYAENADFGNDVGGDLDNEG